MADIQDGQPTEQAFAPPCSLDRIDPHEPGALAFWAAELRISEKKLRAVIAAAGFRLEDIREELASYR